MREHADLGRSRNTTVLPERDAGEPYGQRLSVRVGNWLAGPTFWQ
jgi:hypothetical protein